MPTVAIINEGVRAFLNDANQSVYTDGIILPYINMAYRDLCDELLLNGAKILNEVTSPVIEVAANAETLTSPADLVSVIKLWERQNGGINTDFRQVDKRDIIDPTDISTERINYWVWREGAVEFPAPTTAREVRLLYLKRPTALTTGPLPDASYTSFLTYKAAASIAAAIEGNTDLAGYLDGLAEPAKLKILGQVAQSKQATPVRKRPFRAR